MVQCRPGRLINILNHEDGKEVSVQGGVADTVGVGGAAWDELPYIRQLNLPDRRSVQ